MTKRTGTMTELEKQVLRDLRSRGYLVVTWTPEEIGTANLRVLEDSVVEHGNRVIEGLTDDETI
jgi:hypothetical protein